MSDNPEADSLLDVFTSVEVEDSPISALARGLSDVSIDSLLEQSRQVATQMKGRCRGPGGQFRR